MFGHFTHMWKTLAWPHQLSKMGKGSWPHQLSKRGRGFVILAWPHQFSKRRRGFVKLAWPHQFSKRRFVKLAWPHQFSKRGRGFVKLAWPPHLLLKCLYEARKVSLSTILQLHFETVPTLWILLLLSILLYWIFFSVIKNLFF
jgi:hypothetical protein